MDKIKQITPKHEAETCWNNSNKQQLKFHYFIDKLLSSINFCDYGENREI